MRFVLPANVGWSVKQNKKELIQRLEGGCGSDYQIKPIPKTGPMDHSIVTDPDMIDHPNVSLGCGQLILAEVDSQLLEPIGPKEPDKDHPVGPTGEQMPRPFQNLEQVLIRGPSSIILRF